MGRQSGADDLKPGLDNPAADAAMLTKDDNTNLVIPARALYVGGTGDVAVITVGGSNVTFAAVPAGSILPVRVQRLLSLGTTATSIVALL